MEDRLTINKEYARRYAKKKEAEELSRLRDRYGDQAVEESESSSEWESEDDDAEGLTPALERDFFRTLSLIQKKDPRIYDKETAFYHSEGSQQATENGSSLSSERPKPMFLKDYERKRLLERGSMAGVSDSSEGEQEEEEVEHVPTYNQEQEAIKKSFQEAVAELEEASESNSDDDGDGGDDGSAVLRVKRKTEGERREEESEYVRWLKGEGGRVTAHEAEDIGTLQKYWTDPQLGEDEAFLRDFILNKGYMDKDVARIPSYDEVVAESDQPSDSDDEEALDEQEEFERKYNFRFEEPQGSQIMSYPRTISSSVRRHDDKRKQQRKERVERKLREKAEKKEELKRLKNLKKKEIIHKLDQIKEITGSSLVEFSSQELDGEFDPASHDAAMQRAYGSEFYDQPESDEDKPDLGEEGSGGGGGAYEEGEGLIDWDPRHLRREGEGGGVWEEEEEGEGGGPHCDDPDFNMDADYDPGAGSHDPREPGPANPLKRKRMSKFAAALKRRKPTFDPGAGSWENYFDSYYQLDYEDLIGGDLPCRFKYRQVPQNDFGLTTDEVLSCTDKSLNRWVSLKKAVQCRGQDEEEQDLKIYRKKAKNFEKKKQILTTLESVEADKRQSAKRRKGRSKVQSERHHTHAKERIKDQSNDEKVRPPTVDKGQTIDQPQTAHEGRAKKEPKQDDERTTEQPRKGKKGDKGKGKKNKRSKLRPQLSSARLKAYGL